MHISAGFIIEKRYLEHLLSTCRNFQRICICICKSLARTVSCPVSTTAYSFYFLHCPVIGVTPQNAISRVENHIDDAMEGPHHVTGTHDVTCWSDCSFMPPAVVKYQEDGIGMGWKTNKAWWWWVHSLKSLNTNMTSWDNKLNVSNQQLEASERKIGSTLYPQLLNQLEGIYQKFNLMPTGRK